ncbi:hypothetical protein JCM10908_002060 [Rhodotorula pacifica]|uniref:uncharacterized protein n=1 Tax=Rhodotorula pacifica TaxID=1495444 RepID=UPI00316B058B
MTISGSLLSFIGAPTRPVSASTTPSTENSSVTTTTATLPSGSSILVTDALAVSAQPWLVHFVARALRPQPASGSHHHQQQQQMSSSALTANGHTYGAAGGAGTGKRKVLVLGVREREEWWTGVLKKSGIQLAADRTSGHFDFLSLSDPSVPLSESFARIRDTLLERTSADEEGGVDALIVLDDVSALAWMGHDLREVLRWWNGLRSLLAKSQATLLTLQHYAPAPSAGLEEDPADTHLFRSLLQRSDIWLQVEPLGGGTAGAASSTAGEISVHLAPSYLPIPPFAIDPSCGALSASGPRARPFWVDEAAGGVEIGVKGRERPGGAGKWA